MVLEHPIGPTVNVVMNLVLSNRKGRPLGVWLLPEKENIVFVEYPDLMTSPSSPRGASHPSPVHLLGAASAGFRGVQDG